MLPPKEYHRTLPAKRMGSGAVLRDESGRVLIVQPAYKSGWEIPGGIVEANESPLAGVIRELQEELALAFTAADFSLLSIDYLHETDERTEALMFLFAGPVLDSSRINSIQLPPDELKSFLFIHPAEAVDHLGDLLGLRIQRAAGALASGRACYWEDPG